MAAQNRLVSVSGTDFDGSQAASYVILVAKSGTGYVPVAASAEGHLLTSGV